MASYTYIDESNERWIIVMIWWLTKGNKKEKPRKAQIRFGPFGSLAKNNNNKRPESKTDERDTFGSSGGDNSESGLVNME